MNICPVLLYRCFLSVYSPFLLIAEVHSVASFEACVWRGWTKAMCLVLHTNGVSLYKSRERQTIKRTNMCLVSKRPAAPLSSTLGIITQSHWSQLSFHLGSVRSTNKQNKLGLISHISSRGTGSTFDIAQHEWQFSTSL